MGLKTIDELPESTDPINVNECILPICDYPIIGTPIATRKILFSNLVDTIVKEVIKDGQIKIIKTIDGSVILKRKSYE
jgi:hypothetical protein